MSDELEINDGMVRAVVRPALGAGLVRFDWVHGGVLEPLFRPAPAGATPVVFDFASIVLLPWSNRVSGGGFEFEGRWHPLAPNVPGDPYPNHGNGFELAWQVARASATGVRLTVDSAGPGPYRYAATLDYAVAGGALTMAMAIENRGDSALPFGLGFHPWLVRDPDTLLLAPARAVWLEDAGHLPAGDEPVPIPAGWAFDAASPIEAAARANYALAPIAEVSPADFRVKGGLTFANVNGESRSLWSAPRSNVSRGAAAEAGLS